LLQGIDVQIASLDKIAPLWISHRWSSGSAIADLFVSSEEWKKREGSKKLSTNVSKVKP
jgi:hypothetical protein